MQGGKDVKAAFDSAQDGLRRTRQFLTSSGESIAELERRLIAGLYDVAEPLCTICRTVTGMAGATTGSGQIAGKLNELRSALYQTARGLSVNSEGTNIEMHLNGSANTLDALLNLLAQVKGPGARSPTIVRKQALTTYQTALHGYALAQRAPDTAVLMVRNSGNHDNRVIVTQHLHLAVVDMAGAIEAWTR